MNLKIILQKKDLILCEYIDEDSPFQKYKKLLASESANSTGVEAINIQYIDGSIVSNIVYAAPREDLKYKVFSVSNIYYGGYYKTKYINYTLPFYDEALKYFKKRQVAISTFCALNKCKIDMSTDDYLQVTYYKEFSNIESFREDICKDYLLFIKEETI